MTEPVAVLYGAEDEHATLYEDGEYVHAFGQGTTPVCSEHGAVPASHFASDLDECDHRDPWADGDPLSIPTFEVEDILAYVEAQRSQR